MNTALKIARARKDHKIPDEFRRMSLKDLYAFQDRVAATGHDALLMASWSDFRPTSDEWSPCFPDNMVGISLSSSLSNCTNFWQLYIGGEANDAYAKTFTCKLFALECLEALPTVITKAELKRIGFKFAF